jgi:Phage capsid family
MLTARRIPNGASMNRPLVPEDDPRVKHARAAVYLHRAAAAHLRSFVTGATPANAARSMFGDDSVTDLILRAASAPAAISGTAGWAQALAGVAIYDLVQSITSLSAAADVIDRGLKLDMDGIAEYRVPGRVLSAAAAGQWVGEAMAAPVRALSFSNAAILRPRKLQVLTTYSRELAEHSNVEAVVRQTLGEATGLALDLQMWSSDPGDATKPPGLFAGVTPITATAGGGSNALNGDLANLFAALASHSAGKTAVIIAALPQAVKLKLTAGPKFDYDIVASTALAPGTVAVLEVASFVSGFASTAEFSTTKVGAVHMEDTAPADIVSAGGAVAAPVKSLFQIDAIGLKTTLSAAWGLRAAGHCQYITGATW